MPMTTKAIDSAIDRVYKMMAGNQLSDAEISYYSGVSVSVIYHTYLRAIKKLEPKMKHLV